MNLLNKIKSRLISIRKKLFSIKPHGKHFIEITLKDRINQINLLNSKKIIVFEKKLEGIRLNSKNTILYYSNIIYAFNNIRNLEDEYYFLLNANDIALYNAVVYKIAEKKIKNFNLLIFGKIQFWGGSIISSTNCDEIQWQLFNHFYDYYKINTPILTLIYSKINNKINNFEKSLLLPRRIKSSRLSAKNNKDILSVNFIGLNPYIGSAPHMRWRPQFDVINNCSVTTNHGVHDFELTKQIKTKIFNSNINLNSNIEVVRVKDNKNEILNIFSETSLNKFSKKFFFPKEYEVILSNKKSLEISYTNASSFYFLKSDNSFSGNHIFSRRNTDNLIIKFNKKKIDKIKNYYQKDIIYNQYVSPLSNDNIDFGIHWPSEGKFEAELKLSKTGDKKVTLDGVNDFIIFKEVFKTFQKNELVLINVNWNKDYSDVIHSLNQAELVAKNKITQDFDLTEFQPSWRNQFFHDNEIPHWLGRFKGFSPSCNLCGGLNKNLVTKHTLFLTVKSPHANEEIKKITILINIYDDEGKLISSFEEQFMSNEPLILNLTNKLTEKKIFGST